ncbi:hypothetical protein M8J75_011169 [Diaphorina citri]|nr:hypothetical protein M8J75_011169 [Diaphorina citri]
MVGKQNTTLTERRNSQDSNRSISLRNSQDSINLKSSQESNLSYNDQHITNEETLDLGISILPEKQKKDSDMDTGEMDENSPRSRSYRHPSESNGTIDIDQIENSPPRKSLKRSSSLDLEKFTTNRKKKSSILSNLPCYFDTLSDEVILHIFTFLNKKALVECSQVNKRWRRIVYDDELWTRIDVTSRTLNTTAITSLLERNPKYLRMSQTHFKQVKSLGSLLRTEYLDLSMAKISVEDLGTFLSHFNNLKKLSLEHVTCDLEVCKGIVQNKKLNCLNLTMCKNICEHFLKVLLDNCTCLVSLNLSWCNLNLKCVEILCEHLNPNLIHLNISGCLKNVENRHIELLARRCSNLIELDLSDCTQLTDDVIPVIVNHFPKLSTLSLSRCYNISPREYGVVMSSKTSLKYFNIYGLLHEKQIEILQKNCAHVGINKNKFSFIARPTVGDKRTSIWGYRVRDSNNN